MNRTLIVLAFTCCTAAFGADVVSASLDLRKLGYRQSHLGSQSGSNSELSFISDDLLVISINQWDYKNAAINAPISTVIVFDVARATVTTTGKIAVERPFLDPLQAISGERFAVLNDKGLQFCDKNLRCESIVPTPGPGPLFVSPQGKLVAFGGYQRTAQTGIDTESLRQVQVFGQFQNINPAAIPGDGAILVDHNPVRVQRSGEEDVPLNIAEPWDFREFRFLSPGAVACLDHDASEAVVVFGSDGKEIRRYKVATSWKTGFLPTASGTRFGIYEHGYTRWNSVVNFLDIDEGRPENFQRVRVIDMSTWDEISRFEWDPRSYSIKPAISPDGHRIARVKGGVLEVLQVN